MANRGGSSVTELDASTGALVRVISASAYQFVEPSAMVLDGRDLFVANGGGGYSSGDEGSGGTVTELDGSTGALVRVISGTSDEPDEFDGPDAMVLDGPDLFVANTGVNNGSSVTELKASTGALVTPPANSRSLDVDYPTAMALNGRDLFVANSGGDSVTELDASTGAEVRELFGSAYEFNRPDAMVLDGPDLFVANSGGTVTEFPA